MSLNEFIKALPEHGDLPVLDKSGNKSKKKIKIKADGPVIISGGGGLSMSQGATFKCDNCGETKPMSQMHSTGTLASASTSPGTFCTDCGDYGVRGGVKWWKQSGIKKGDAMPEIKVKLKVKVKPGEKPITSQKIEKGTTYKDGPGLPEDADAPNTVKECGDCGFIGTGDHDCPKPHSVEKSVVMGTRPFGRKVGSETEDPSIRAKAPRYRKGAADEEGDESIEKAVFDTREHGACMKCGQQRGEHAGPGLTLEGHVYKPPTKVGSTQIQKGDVGVDIRPVGGTIGNPKPGWAKMAKRDKTNPAAVQQIKDARANTMGTMKSFGLLLKSGFSRMHFEAAAEAIGHAHANAKTPEAKKAVEETARHMAARFKTENPRFDHGRFERRWQEHAGIIEKPKPKKRKPSDPNCADCGYPRSYHGVQGTTLPCDGYRSTLGRAMQAHASDLISRTKDAMTDQNVPDSLPDDIKNMKSQQTYRP